jgi:hypothetical protein
MMMQTGLVIADFTACDALVSTEIERAIEATPEGRVLAVIYDLPRDWGTTYPWESMVSSVILKDPLLRSSEPDWQILSTLAIRCCKVGGKNRKVTREIGVALFAKKGSKAYKRRGSTTKKVTTSSQLETLHPAFTRDVANNVWHLSSSNPISEIKHRLTALLTWSDESTLCFRKGRRMTVSHDSLDLDIALIGVPTKVLYTW